MPGLGPAINVRDARKNVDARVKPGHDDEVSGELYFAFTPLVCPPFG
jgi:hypothetical protein